ncbi:hypothetical protein [Microbacterium aurum]
MHITRYDEHGQELKPGLRSLHHHNLTSPKFVIFTTLEAVDPDQWRAEVLLFDEVILTVDGLHASKQAAGQAAEQALRTRLIEMFGSAK